MKHSIRFNNIQNFYDSGAWSVAQVRQAVTNGWITKEEFQMITGHDF